MTPTKMKINILSLNFKNVAEIHAVHEMSFVAMNTITFNDL